MKIAQIVCTFPPYRGGIGNSVYNISDVLSDLGHEVTVFTPEYAYADEENKFADQLTEAEGKFTIRRLKPIFKFGNGAFIPQLFFKLNDFDIVHLHYPFYGALKAVLFRKLLSGKKMKLMLHYHMDNKAEGFKGFIFCLYKALLLPILVRAANIITCASLDYIKHSNLEKYYRLKPDKFRQISFGVNLDQFVTYHDNLNDDRRHKVLLFVGGLDQAHYFKGLENLIRALAEIIKNPKFSSTILNVVGSGNLLEYYKKIALDLGVEKLVFFHEMVDNSKLVDFYNYCDCLVLPSINQSEAFGLVLLEAMACSRPVITSNLPGVRGVFKNRKQGLLVEPDNIKDLIKKIQIVLGDKKKAKEMGLAGRELVEKKYTWVRVGKRLDSIYYHVKFNPLL
ncbi:MAG: glycosyltransferase family 4 protein [bacterium]|nr:glycosyltransferase family 4 protein [bacterium]